MNNVYSDPEYAEIVKELKQKLMVLRVKYKDSPELDSLNIDQFIYRRGLSELGH